MRSLLATLSVGCLPSGGGDGGDEGPAQGTAGGACYPNDTCNDDLECRQGRCVSQESGALGGPCYGNGTCNADLTCSAGACVQGSSGRDAGAREAGVDCQAACDQFAACMAGNCAGPIGEATWKSGCESACGDSPDDFAGMADTDCETIIDTATERADVRELYMHGGMGAGQDDACVADSGELGVCLHTADCEGVSVPGFCGAALADVQCCVGHACFAEGGREGRCLNESTCEGTTERGLCPGGNEVRCCL